VERRIQGRPAAVAFGRRMIASDLLRFRGSALLDGGGRVPCALIRGWPSWPAFPSTQSSARQLKRDIRDEQRLSTVKIIWGVLATHTRQSISIALQNFLGDDDGSRGAQVLHTVHFFWRLCPTGKAFAQASYWLTQILPSNARLDHLHSLWKLVRST
jgi:hypothetical protein